MKEKAAKRLINAMVKKGLRQQELADLSGVTKSSISHYVNAKNIPDKEQAYKLAKVLEVSPEWLRCEDESPLITVENTELQKLIAQMGPDMIAKVTAYAQAMIDMKNSKGEQIR